MTTTEIGHDLDSLVAANNWILSIDTTHFGGAFECRIWRKTPNLSDPHEFVALGTDATITGAIEAALKKSGARA